MAFILNYNQLKDLFESVALSMNQVNGFQWLMPSETLNTEDLNYPVISFEADPFITVQDALEEYRWAFYVLDRNYEDVHDRVIRLGYTKLLGQNFISILYRDYQEMFPQPSTYSMNVIVDDFADRVTGWRFEIVLQLDVNWNQCDLLDIFNDFQTDPINIQAGDYLDDGDPVV